MIECARPGDGKNDMLVGEFTVAALRPLRSMSRAWAAHGRSRSSIGPTFAVLREAIGQLDPPELAARAGVIFWRDSFGIIKAASRDVDLVRGVVVLKGQRGAAVRAEGPQHLRGRSESSRRARDESELRPWHAEPGYEWRGRSPAADRAVAIRLVKGCASGFVANAATEATTFQHLGALL